MEPTCQCQIAYSKVPPFRTEVATCLVASDPRGAMMTGGAILPQSTLQTHVLAFAMPSRKSYQFSVENGKP